MPRRNPAVELSQRFVDHLTRLRASGGHEPLALNQLIVEAASSEPAEVVAQALAKKPFKGGAIIALKALDTSPVGLKDGEGVAQLAAAPSVLQAALQALASSGPGAWPIAKVVAKVATELKKPFKAILEQQVAGGTVPAGVGVWVKGRTRSLYLKDRPPPALALAAQLVQRLEQRRQQAPRDYAITLDRLIAEVAPSVDAGVIAKALTQPLFAERVLWVAAKDRASPVFLRGDETALARSETFLQFALAAVRSGVTQAFTAKDLVKKAAAPLRAGLAAALDSATARELPPFIGFLSIKGKRHFFRIEDVSANSAVAASPASPASGSEEALPARGDFAAAFDSTFDRLDRQGGSLNFVSLRDLRPALAVFSRAEFDAGLLQLRRERRYSLKAAEGFGGLSAQEREAGILEEGDLLLNVSRLRS